MGAFTSFKDYMYYLLHNPLKSNTLLKFFTVVGAELDELKDTIFEVREQSNILTASNKYLDLHGKDRDMYRYINEDDETYRNRLLTKFEISKKAGTLRGLELVLNSMGYTEAEIKGLFAEDETRWAEFWIDLNTKDKRVTLQDLALVHNEVMKIKQASSKPNYYAKNNVELDTSLNIALFQTIKNDVVVAGEKPDCNVNNELFIRNKISIYRKIIIKGE